MKVVVDEKWSDCPYRTCHYKSVTIEYAGNVVEAGVDSEVIEVRRVGVLRSVAEAAEVAMSLIEAANLPRVKAFQEIIAELFGSLAEDVVVVDEGREPVMLPHNRYACWAEDYLGKPRERCAVTAFVEILVPKKWRLVQVCAPTWGFHREEECDWRPGVVEWQRVETLPLGGKKLPPEKLTYMNVKPTDNAKKEAIARLVEMRRRLAEFLASL